MDHGDGLYQIGEEAVDTLRQAVLFVINANLYKILINKVAWETVPPINNVPEWIPTFI